MHKKPKNKTKDKKMWGQIDIKKINAASTGHKPYPCPKSGKRSQNFGKASKSFRFTC